MTQFLWDSVIPVRYLWEMECSRDTVFVGLGDTREIPVGCMQTVPCANGVLMGTTLRTPLISVGRNSGTHCFHVCLPFVFAIHTQTNKTNETHQHRNKQANKRTVPASSTTKRTNNTQTNEGTHEHTSKQTSSNEQASKQTNTHRGGEAERGGEGGRTGGREGWGGEGGRQAERAYPV